MVKAAIQQQASSAQAPRIKSSSAEDESAVSGYASQGGQRRNLLQSHVPQGNDGNHSDALCGQVPSWQARNRACYADFQAPLCRAYPLLLKSKKLPIL